MYRYHREKPFFEFVKAELDKLNESKYKEALEVFNSERHIMHQEDFETKTLFKSLLISEHKPIQELMDGFSHEGLNKVKIYLTKDLEDVASIYRYQRSLKKEEAIIQVSPAFLNNYTAGEQRSILAHEYMHYHHGHAGINAITRIYEKCYAAKLSLPDNFKMQYDKFSICKEISADIGALVLTGFDYDSMQSAFIKAHFGFYAKGFEEIILNMFNAVSKQFTTTKNINCSPISLLRFKIIDHLKNNNINSYDDEHIKKINKLIDEKVDELYPILVNKKLNKEEKHFLIHAGLAVVIADGEVTISETDILLNEFANWSRAEKEEINKIVGAYTGRLRSCNVDDLVKELIDKVDDEKTLKKVNKPLMYRYLLDIGHADRVFRKEERKVVTKCGKDLLCLKSRQRKILYMFCGEQKEEPYNSFTDVSSQIQYLVNRSPIQLR